MRSVHRGVAPAKSSARRCPVCGGDGRAAGRTVSFAEAPSAAIYRCAGCGYLWILRDRFSTASRTRELEIRGRTTTSAWVLERLPEEIKRRRDVRVLDIGCWDGSLLGGLPTDWRRVGVEPNPQAAETARGRGLEVVDAPMETATLPTGGFDLVLMMDVLEHLSEPVAALRKAAGWLAPGGRLFAVTGNGTGFAARLYGGRWYYLNYPDHVGCFGTKSIRLALREVALDVQSLRMDAHETAHLAETVRKIRARLSGTRRAWDDGLGRADLWRDLLPLALSRISRRRDHMVVTARKKGGPE